MPQQWSQVLRFLLILLVIIIHKLVTESAGQGGSVFSLVGDAPMPSMRHRTQQRSSEVSDSSSIKDQLSSCCPMD